jgi:excisionase family DNA binding protein
MSNWIEILRQKMSSINIKELSKPKHIPVYVEKPLTEEEIQFYTREIEQVTFITTKKAATMCGLSLGTVQKMTDKGIFKYYLTFGGHRRILLSSVNDYLKARDSELENGGM